MTNLLEHFNRKPGQSVIIGYILVLLLGGADYISGNEISFSIFYLLPILFVAWFKGRKNGIAISVFAAAIWLAADILWSPQFSHPAIVYWNAIVRLGFFMVTTYILCHWKVSLEHEKELSRTDFLTGVPNSRAFYEILDSEIERSRRLAQPMTIAYIDIDNFKSINDKLGHPTGDKLLSTIASGIKNSLRVIDTVARLGGDEFVILMPATNKAQAKTAIDRVFLNAKKQMEDNNWPSSLSIGMITYINPPASVNQVITNADNLMYTVKSSGKNRIRHEEFAE